MIKVGIIGSTGYAGGELARLLLQRDDIEIKWYGSRSYIGQKYASLYPNMYKIVDEECMDDNMKELAGQVDVVFTATPQGLCASLVDEEILSKVKIIDLSADFRIKDVSVYEEWYKLTHASPQFLEEAVYGLPEVNRERVKKARLIANPGCFPTCSFLSVYPLVKEGLALAGVPSGERRPAGYRVCGCGAAALSAPGAGTDHFFFADIKDLLRALLCKCAEEVFLSALQVGVQRLGVDAGGLYAHLPPNLLAVLEEDDGGNAHNAVLAGQRLVLIHVHLTDKRLALVLLAQVLHNRSQHLAGTAPSGPEVHHGDGGSGDFFVELGFIQMQNRHDSFLLFIMK